jgi:CheY-like chemotaxis protein
MVRRRCSVSVSVCVTSEDRTARPSGDLAKSRGSGTIGVHIEACDIKQERAQISPDVTTARKSPSGKHSGDRRRWRHCYIEGVASRTIVHGAALQPPVSATVDLARRLAELLQPSWRVQPISASPAGSLLEGVKVLIVPGADSAELKDAVVQYGGSATLAASAQEATRLLQTVRPDVLVSDLTVPGNGLWLMEEAERIALEEGLSFGAIAITARKSEYQRQRLLRAGFKVYLGRPLDPWAFCEAVAELAGRKPGLQQTA